MAVLSCGPAAAQGPPPLVPPNPTLGETAARALQAAWLNEEERRDLRVFHGVWSDADLTSPALRAAAALNAWNFDDPALSDLETPVELRADALLKQGRAEAALDLLQDIDTIRAARLKAEAFEELGQLEQANQAVNAPVAKLLKTRVESAADLTDAVRAMFVRSRIEGQPARDFQTMIDLLGRAHQELDRLYWPARLAEAELLLDKDNTREAVEALHEVLELNPRCAAAWYELGTIALRTFDFGSAQRAADALRRIHPDHPLAALLGAEASLIEDDPDMALQLLDPLLARLPELRPALALAAAAHARRYDAATLQLALDRYEQFSPGSAKPYLVVGRHLTMDRQYDEAAKMLETAIERQPAWPAPRIELGLLEMQSGRETNALRALQEVVKLDRFNKRAVNSLQLLEELAEYDQIETEHFLIRYKPGIDEVFARTMPEPLERIHAIDSQRFQHEPDRKTIIQVLPDHQRFGVRITGMPGIHTIAACTGPVIALEVPREGPPHLHLGLFDWPRVLQHEYAHTITLSQTRNRIPHWLTEAAAVSVEPGPRDFDRCKLLARAVQTDTLFDFDEINWAFVRPRKPTDRAQAYAQGHWMVEFMNERFGESALVRLINRYFDGVREEQAITEALGITREQFFADFKVWAAKQVESWGLDAKPSMIELTDELRAADPELTQAMNQSQQARLDAIVDVITRRVGAPKPEGDEPLTAERWPDLVRPPVEIDDDTLGRWLGEYPEHPDLLELFVRRKLATADAAENPELIALLERYAKARPVDDFPDRKLAQIYLARGESEQAIEHLERLDALEQKSPIFALELAKQYRDLGRLDQSLAKVTRAVQINPYHPANRELAAAIAIEAQRYDAAREHIWALTKIEPDRPQHLKRLEKIEELLQQGN